MIYNKRSQMNKEDILRGIVARHKKRKQEETHVKKIFKDNKRWKEYSDKREAAIENYFNIMKMNRKLTHFVTLIKVK